MVPLAKALRLRGHEVAFATAERFCRRVIEPAGFSAFPAGLSPPAVEEETNRRLALAGLPAGDEWSYGAHMFAAVAAPAKVPDLVRIVDEWAPQLVVHDAIDFAAPIASARAGLSWVSHSFGALQPIEFWALAHELVAPAWKAWNIDLEEIGDMFGYLYLDICPPSFQALDADRIGVRQLLRPIPFDAPHGEETPQWFSQLPHRPTVYVTMGTIFNDTPNVFETILTSLGESAVNVVATVGLDRDPDELGALPHNVHVERWIPQSQVLGRCDAVVCHGGSGTTLAALTYGLPLLVLPQGANQFWNAERCVSLGVGLSLRMADLNPIVVRQSVNELLLNPSFRSAAREVQGEIEQMPTPAEVAPSLEGLARNARRDQ
jgi:UDP:flavonoid glycosyltransferase YjiC (YdhE family)